MYTDAEHTDKPIAKGKSQTAKALASVRGLLSESGFCLIYCWIYLYCYDPLFSIDIEGYPRQALFLTFIAFQIATLFSVLLFPERAFPLGRNRHLMVGSAIALAAATVPHLFLDPIATNVADASSATLPMAVFVTAAALAGLSTSIFTIAWGERVSIQPIRQSSVSVSVSIALAFALFVLMTPLPSLPKIIIMAVLPLASTALLILVGWEASVRSPQLDASSTSSPGQARPRTSPLPWAVALAVFVFGTLAAMVINSTSTLVADYYRQSFRRVLGLSNLAVPCLMLLGMAVFRDSMRVGFTYKPLILIMALGALMLFTSSSSFVATVLLINARIYFYVLSFAMFADIAYRMYSPAGKVFALGRLLDNIGFVTGYAAGALLSDYAGSDEAFVYMLSMVLVAVLLFAPLVLLNERSVESGWGKRTRGADNRRDSANMESVSTLYGLTSRETEVLSFLAEGRSQPWIAKRLLVSESTVKTHVKSIYKKLDVHDRQSLLDLLKQG